MQLTIIPRFSEVDIMGHVSNTAMPVWFEQGRIPIFKLFSTTANFSDLSLILRRQEVEYLAQTFIEHEVVIHTKIIKIGTSSITIEHQAIQNNVLVATGICVMVHFDYQAHKSLAIPEALCARLMSLN
ncbi:thioesterase family protein [Pseudomonas sp. F1_0610]|uniref:acyl-CoA thioesterase n=1 Tax=Pseudomonas sp. F1_0610 TaxID=3114284 RepID=UPI0039C03448